MGRDSTLALPEHQLDMLGDLYPTLASPEHQLDMLGDLYPDPALAVQGEDGQAGLHHLQLVHAKP